MNNLVSLTKAQVPEYLVGSEFYNSLSADGGEDFRIPRKFLKPNVSVASGAELAHLFHTMKFWGLKGLPDDIIELLIFKSKVIPESEEGPIKDVLREFDDEFKLFHLFETLPVCSLRIDRVDSAVECGREDVLEYIYRVEGQVNEWAPKSLAEAAAKNGFFHLLQQITGEYLAKFGKSPYDHVSTATVASRGHSECLQYLLENDCNKEKRTCRAAAENGHLACLKIACEHGCAWNKHVADAAAKNGHLDCLKYALEQSGLEKAADAACAAADGGQVECLQYILHQGVAPTRSMCNAACGVRGTSCLKLLHARGVPWDIRTAKTAVESGSVSCLKFLLDEGREVNSSVALLAAAMDRNECLHLLLTMGCDVNNKSVDAAAKRGHLASTKVLKSFNIPLEEDFLCRVVAPEYGYSYDDEDDEGFWEGFEEGYDGETYIRTLVDVGYTMPSCVFLRTVSCGKAECVEYMCATESYDYELSCFTASAAAEAPNSAVILDILRRYGCPWNEQTCSRAAGMGHLEGLTFALENGCPWDPSTIKVSIQPRDQSCLQYAVQHSCSFPDDACEIAARRGLTDSLQLLHEHGGALTLQVCLAATTYNYLDCLTYAVKHGAQVDASVCASAAARTPMMNNCSTSMLMLKCAREFGCPWDERTTTAAILWNYKGSREYALAHNCPVSDDACALAAQLGFCDKLELLHKHGCPLTLETCVAAATYKFTDCLLYAVMHGAPMDVSVCVAAVTDSIRDTDRYYHNHYRRVSSVCMLQCVRELGCPWDTRVSQAAAESGNTACLRYCVEQGCPISKATMEKYNTL